eukprot:506318_1
MLSPSRNPKWQHLIKQIFSTHGQLKIHVEHNHHGLHRMVFVGKINRGVKRNLTHELCAPNPTTKLWILLDKRTTPLVHIDLNNAKAHSYIIHKHTTSPKTKKNALFIVQKNERVIRGKNPCIKYTFEKSTTHTKYIEKKSIETIRNTPTGFLSSPNDINTKKSTETTRNTPTGFLSSPNDINTKKSTETTRNTPTGFLSSPNDINTKKSIETIRNTPTGFLSSPNDINTKKSIETI